MSINLHEEDLPAGVALGPLVAVDTETMGLRPTRDRLCLVQLSAGDGDCHLVRFRAGGYEAPNLVRLLGDPRIEKIFHFARFDIAILRRYLGVLARPVWCTKIASKLARTYTDRHGLKELCQELLGVELSKQMQSSDWGAAELSEAQLSYAANDVLHLHRLRERLGAMLERDGRAALARACFDFVPHRAELDLAGWADDDIFAY
jgi:ribonuclease D